MGDLSDDDIQAVVETVDDLLQEALNAAEIYASHEEVRPSAIRGFDKVEEARIELDAIDKRDFNEPVEDADE